MGTLTISGYNTASPLGDAMSYHNGMKFSAKDKDQDNNPEAACSNSYQDGGWWFNWCYRSYPNGNTGDIKWLQVRDSSDGYQNWYGTPDIDSNDNWKSSKYVLVY